MSSPSGDEKDKQNSQNEQQETTQDIMDEKKSDNDDNIPIKSTDSQPTPSQNNNNDIDQIKEHNDNNIQKELDFELDEIDENKEKETRDIYYEQCPTLKHNEDQKDLFILLSLQRKNDYPLMIHLIDSYLRDRLHHFIQSKSNKIYKNLQIQEWGQNYPTIHSLLKQEKEYKKLKKIILGGMQMFFNRYCSPFSLPTQYKINDSIERFVQCIDGVNALIMAILQNPIEIPPFQIDLLIIPQDVIDIHTLNDSEDDEEDYEDDEFSDDSDDDDDDDDDEEEVVTKQKKTKGDEIGNIEKRLNEQKLKYATKGPEEPAMYRAFRDLYENYKNGVYNKNLSNLSPNISVQTSTLSESDSKENESMASPKSETECMEDTDNTNIENVSPISTKSVSLDNIAADLTNLPHRKRLVIVVDRRLGEYDKEDAEINGIEEKNKLFMFETPSFNDIPKQYVKEWYFESSIQCVIPSINDNANYNIKSKTSMDGWINIFSFHVEQKEEIRCYFYRDGKILRFMPNDIIDLFPQLFDEKAYENHKFTETEREQKLNINRLKWEDKTFDNFREQLNYT